ncbi:hypothetical protein [Tolypothrix sp. VBCCA 56010]|uniref:hypothetical protein n=1 Tax=Tolypothrix sp. VBCCA 56010 TaxID=3137731 RepID=UPI003D7D842C
MLSFDHESFARLFCKPDPRKGVEEFDCPVFRLRRYLGNGGKPGTPEHERLVWAVRKDDGPMNTMLVNGPKRFIAGRGPMVVPGFVITTVIVMCIPTLHSRARRKLIRDALKSVNHTCRRGRRFNRGKGG